MNENGRATTFDEWISQASVEDLQRELGEKEHALKGTLREVEALETKAQGLHEEITRRKRVLDVLVEVQPARPVPGRDAAPASLTTMSKREIAERIISESLKALFPREVRDVAVERGWLPDTPNAANQLSVAMNKAAKQDKLVRDDEGRYSLPGVVCDEDIDPPQLLASHAEAQE